MNNYGDAENRFLTGVLAEVAGELFEFFHPIKDGGVLLDGLFERFHGATVALGRKGKGTEYSEGKQ
jgi:hypothetical protein